MARPGYLVVFFLLLGALSAHAAPVIHGLAANANSIPRLDKYELVFTLSDTAFTNAYDPDQIDVTATFTDSQGHTKQATGFYMRDFTRLAGPGEHLSGGSWHWCVRFSPDRVGPWTVHLKVVDAARGTATAGPLAFTCTASPLKGLVRVSPLERRYLQFDDGSQFIPIGQNLAWSTTAGLYSRDFDTWIPKIAAHGGNLIRWWFTTFNTSVEWDEDSIPHSVLGNYGPLQDQHWRADYILEKARTSGLQVLLTLLNHGDLRTKGFQNKWARNLYNAAQGGPCANPQDFFTTAAAKACFKRRLRYIVARWGYLPNTIWEVWNEVDFTDNYNSPAAVAWHTEMIDYLHALEAHRHLVTNSFSDPASEDPAVWKLAGIDLTGFHRYSANTAMENEHVAAVLAHHTLYGKPVLGGEVGITGGSTIEADPTGVHFHNANWGGITSGAAGTPLFWEWNYIETLNLYPQYRALANFTQAIDFQHAGFTFRQPTVMTPTCTTSTVAPDPNTQWGTQYGTGRFRVDPSGDLVPDASKLNRFLPDASKKTWHNPPTFYTLYLQPGSFTFDVVHPSGTNTVQVTVDGVAVLTHVVRAPATYYVPISPGAHAIQVDVTSGDWIEVGRFDFVNYAPAVRVYALQGADTIAGWAVNRDYHHAYVKAHGTPPAITGAVIRLAGVADGLWNVEWWDTFTGRVASTSQTSCTGGVLDLALPGISKDWAFKATYSGPVPATLKAPRHPEPR